MRASPWRRPSPAMIVAFVALFASLGGTAFAVKLVGSRQIADNSVRSVDIHDRTLRRVDFKKDTLLRGPRGFPGANGSDGRHGRDAGTIVDGGGCAAIQKAINGLPAGGGAVLVRPGVYACNSAIVIDRDNVALRGSGPATLLRLGNNVNRPVIVLGGLAAVPLTTRRNLVVSDLAIDGNRANQPFECSRGPCTAQDYLRNNGVSLRRVTDAVVERVIVTNARSGGLVPELGSRRVTVSDFTASLSFFDGLAGYETEDSTFTRLYLHDNDAAGMSFDGDFTGNTVTEAVVADNGDVGIFMLDAHDNLFSGLRVRDSGSDGIFMSAANVADPTSCASGNTFTGSMIKDSGGFGIEVPNADCDFNVVCATQLVGNDDGAIFEAVPGLVRGCENVTR